MLENLRIVIQCSVLFAFPQLLSWKTVRKAVDRPSPNFINLSSTLDTTSVAVSFNVNKRTDGTSTKEWTTQTLILACESVLA